MDTPSGFDPVPASTRRSTVITAVGCAVAVVAMVSWFWLESAAVRRRASARRVVSVVGDNYVGSKACQECHPGEASLHTRSGHAQTLRPAASLELARWLAGSTVQDPEHPDVAWSYRLEDGRLIAERTDGDDVEEQVLDFAFGSGHNAVTFVSLTDERVPASREHRLTHFTDTGTLAVTPGQRVAAPVHGTTPRGRNLGAKETLKCFGCHTTRTSAHDDTSLDLATMIPNVSCERCHGPGRAHVEAERRGVRDRSLTRSVDFMNAEREMLFCGQCHRHPTQAPPGRIRVDNTELARYQPVGLMQSRCYRETEGGIRCVTCHDPHATTKSDPRATERTCLGCHEAAPQAVCRVSPTSGCIGCHMPGVDSGQDVKFTDHWIRIRDDLSGP
jgi:hypothetical protein